MRRFMLLFLMLLLGVGLLAAQSKSKTDTKSDKSAPSSEKKTTPGFDINALDKTVDPCANFYQYACGGWRANNPIPGDESRWGRFNELARRNQDVLHDILEKASKA